MPPDFYHSNGDPCSGDSLLPNNIAACHVRKGKIQIYLSRITFQSHSASDNQTTSCDINSPIVSNKSAQIRDKVQSSNQLIQKINLIREKEIDMLLY